MSKHFEGMGENRREGETELGRYGWSRRRCRRNDVTDTFLPRADGLRRLLYGLECRLSDVVAAFVGHGVSPCVDRDVVIAAPVGDRLTEPFINRVSYQCV